VPNETGNLSAIPVLIEAERLAAAKPKTEGPKEVRSKKKASKAARPAALRAPFAAAEAKAAQRAWAEYLSVPMETSLDLGGGQKLELVLIPPGTFTMGSPVGEKDRRNDEAAHAVTLTQPFYLGKYAVTQAQYRAVTGYNPSYFSAQAQGKEGVKYNVVKPGGGKEKAAGLDTRRFPVENVSWDEAQEFSSEVGRIAGKKVGLPSEAEWEYACRAGTTTPFHFGGVLNGKQANCNGGFPYGTQEKGPYKDKTSAVGSYAPNAWGLYDMHGNVWQWCQDWYGPYDGLGETDPLRVYKSTVNARVLRGGSWLSYARSCRAACRFRLEPSFRVDLGYGVRVAVRLD
jgi:formylglycine-generating enzyme required for sulfatase activity